MVFIFTRTYIVKTVFTNSCHFHKVSFNYDSNWMNWKEHKNELFYSFIETPMTLLYIRQVMNKRLTWPIVYPSDEQYQYGNEKIQRTQSSREGEGEGSYQWARVRVWLKAIVVIIGRWAALKVETWRRQFIL
jgi:hypothetical protein